VKVPAEDLLGGVGNGFKIALEILNSGRLGLAAGSSRGTREMMKLAIAHAKQREQFGRRLARFEMIQRKIAMAAADCYASDAGWMLCAGMVDRGASTSRSRRRPARSMHPSSPSAPQRGDADRRRHRLLQGVSVRARPA
jgi:alkylation response protein AidB-like acyl-CoA dehydrogenase